jgi:hypothetical protein
MKTMTCNQLGGACDKVFRAETFQEMAKLSQRHGADNVNEPAHAAAMAKMTELMEDPDGMQAWMEKKEAEFNALPDGSN